mgnify:FL=1
MVNPHPGTITTKEWSLIYSCEGDPAELYHLPSDPMQERNLIGEKREIAQEILNKFVSHLKNLGVNSQILSIRKRF